MLNFDSLEKALGIVLCMVFQGNCFSCKYSVNCPKFIVWLPLPLEYWATCVLQLFSFLSLEIINFEIMLSNQAVFIHDQKFKTNV